MTIQGQHTPGPWSILRGDNWVIDSADGVVAQGYVLEDVRLISAAPDLLEALEAIVDHFGDPLKVAGPAIAKAKGRRV